MKYKESRFTYKVENEEGDLLLYNTLVGTKSLLKIKNTTKERYENELLPSAKEELHNILYSKGILVNKEDDEDNKLKLLYLKNIGSNILTLVILPTEQCNFRCKYCYETFENRRMDKKTQDAVIQYVRTNINRYSGLHVMWFGGEPLMAMDVIEYLSTNFMNICKRNKKRYTAHMTTNGYYFDSKKVHELTKYNIYSYQITIDGLEETHDQQRVLANGQGTFKVIFNNLRDIKQNCKSKYLDILIRTNVTKEIYDCIEEYVEMINEFFGDDKRFYLSIHQAGNWLDKTTSDFKENLIQESMFRSLYSRLLKKNIIIKNLACNELEPGGVVCYSGQKNTMVITAKGDIHRCTLLFENKELNIGQIEDERLHIEEYKMAEWIGDNSYCKDKETCFYAPCCLGDHCPATRMGLIDCDKELYKCPYTKDSVDLVIKMLDKAKKIHEICV